MSYHVLFFFYFYCVFFYFVFRVFFPQRTHLAFAAQSPKKLVALEFGLLVRYDPRHLEYEPGWSRLFIKTHPVEGQHADAGVLTHSMHHPRRQVLTVPPGRYLFSPSPRERVPTITILLALIFARKGPILRKSRSCRRDMRIFLEIFSSRAKSRYHDHERRDTPTLARPRSTRCDASMETGVPGAPSCWVSLAPGNPTRPKTAPRFSSFSHPWNRGHLSSDRLSIYLASQPVSQPAS